MNIKQISLDDGRDSSLIITISVIISKRNVFSCRILPNYPSNIDMQVKNINKFIGKLAELFSSK